MGERARISDAPRAFEPDCRNARDGLGCLVNPWISRGASVSIYGRGRVKSRAGRVVITRTSTTMIMSAAYSMLLVWSCRQRKALTWIKERRAIYRQGEIAHKNPLAPAAMRVIEECSRANQIKAQNYELRHPGGAVRPPARPSRRRIAWRGLPPASRARFSNSTRAKGSLQ